MSAPDHTPDPDLKRCSKCQVFKPLSEFGKEPKAKNGLQSQCKACKSKQSAEYRASHVEQCKARSKRYYAEHRTEMLEYQAKYAVSHPEIKKRARRKYTVTHPDKVNAHTRKYKARHREHIAEYNATYRKNNHARVRKQARDYYRSHREECAAYFKKNPHVGRLAAQRRRARLKGLPNNFSRDDEIKMYEYFDHCCAVCGKPVGLWHILALDHWIPISNPNCPGTIPTNIVPLCHDVKDGEGSCNKSKLNRDPREWLISTFGVRKANKILKRIQTYFDSLKKETE